MKEHTVCQKSFRRPTTPILLNKYLREGNYSDYIIPYVIISILFYLENVISLI